MGVRVYSILGEMPFVLHQCLAELLKSNNSKLHFS